VAFDYTFSLLHHVYKSIVKYFSLCVHSTVD
jgi:hypothetical protein